MLMLFRVNLQLNEAVGDLNRYYCSQAHGYDIHEEEKLVRYYVKSGGAKDFARRWDEAMGDNNRWYCSEFFMRPISDPLTLWNYYMFFAPLRAAGLISRYDPSIVLPIPNQNQSIAC
jgi:hypothetical protein